MARTTRSARRFKRAKRELVWTSVLFDNVAAGVAGGGSSSALVAPVDWVRGANFEKGATLLGIRGWYQITYSSSSTLGNPTCFLAIWKSDADEVNQNFTVAAAYNGEDILYTDGCAMGGALTPVFGDMSSSPNLPRQLEVKARRKLDSDEIIALAFQAPTAAEDWLITGVFRSLVQLP